MTKLKMVVAGALAGGALLLAAAPAEASSCATWCSGRTGSDYIQCLASCANNGGY